jgi:adenosine deaminase
MENKHKVRVSFSLMYDNPPYEDMDLTYEVAEDMHISTFHRLCKNFARAAGFTEQSVEKYFGETQWED